MTYEQYIELENLYNTLLMRHDDLPSEIHKHWNTQAMESIDTYLSNNIPTILIEIEQEIENVEVVENTIEENRSVNEVIHNYYEPFIAGVYEQVNDTTIEIYAYNHAGWDVKIARFNFLHNVGYYYDLNGDIHHVERYSNLIRKLNKIDNLFGGINIGTIEKIKKNVRKIRKESQF